MFSRNRNTTTKTAPTAYPRLPFHAFRFFQLISSLIVAGIMSYFTYHLRHDRYDEPWTFIWLFSASLASIAALTCTILLHCLLGLNPRLNLGINGLLAVLWGLSFGLLTWYMSSTLGETCDKEHWNEEVGIMVCRIYKALWTFTLVGLASTLLALFLDIYVHRSQTSRGVYRLPDHSSNDLKRSHPEATRGPFTDDVAADPQMPYGHGGLSAPRDSDVWEESRPSIGPYSEQKSGLMGPEPTIYGYEPTPRQYSGEISDVAVFGRHDTGYHGSGGPR